MLETATQKPVGDGHAPRDEDGEFVRPPYTVLYVMPAPPATGPHYQDPEADLPVAYQITSVGEDRKQAQWMQQQARTAMIGRWPTGDFIYEITLPSGIEIMDRRCEGGSDGVIREGNVFNGHDTYTIVLTPA